jgi:hypothetical protein
MTTCIEIRFHLKSKVMIVGIKEGVNGGKVFWERLNLALSPDPKEGVHAR